MNDSSDEKDVTAYIQWKRKDKFWVTRSSSKKCKKNKPSLKVEYCVTKRIWILNLEFIRNSDTTNQLQYMFYYQKWQH